MSSENNLGYGREYYLRNREKLIARMKEIYREKIEEKRAYGREYSRKRTAALHGDGNLSQAEIEEIVQKRREYYRKRREEAKNLKKTEGE